MMLLKLLLLAAGSLITFLVMFVIRSAKKEKARQCQDLEEAFGMMGDAKPLLKFGSSIGWPTFTVTFKSREDLNEARLNNWTDDFEKRISRYYGHDFEARKAVYFTYEGWQLDSKIHYLYAEQPKSQR